MKFSIRFADQIVGTLVILALAILVFVIFMLGKSQRWFAHDYQYMTYFNSASGLNKNMSVQYKGFTIGHVKKIELTKEDAVEVTFIIFEEHNHRVKEGSLVEVQASPIGLGNSFLFHPGRGGQLAEWAVIPEINSAQAKWLVDMNLADPPESNDSINYILNQVTFLIDTINNAIAATDENGKTALESILENMDNAVSGFYELAESLNDQINPILGDIESITGGLYGQISPILDNIETVTGKLSDPSGTVMSILDSEGPVFSDISQALDSITGSLRSLEKTIEFVPANLPQVAVLLSDLHSALAEAEKLIIALTNNPLLKGGVPEYRETGPGAATPRDLEF